MSPESKRDIGQETLEGIRAIKRGDGRRFNVAVPPVIAARHQLGMSQAQFAHLLGVSVRTLQQWEQGRREPSGAARSLLILAEKHPEILREVFG